MNAKTVIFTALGVVSIGVWCAGADDPLQDAEWGKRSVLRAGQEIYGDYFSFGRHVEISGVVHGDVYAAGGEVLIDGIIDGDLIVAGGEVTLSGRVAQDARIAGGKVTLSGQIDRNASIAGGDVQLTDTAVVEGNVLVGAGNVLLAGKIARDARLGAGSVTVSNAIGRDLTVAAGNIRLTSKASIGGNLKYWSEDDPSIDEGATISGTVIKRPIPEDLKADKFRQRFMRVRMVGTAVSMLSTLALGLLLLRVYPVFSESVAATIHERPWGSLALGGALLVGVPLLALLCFVTIVGIPIGLILGAIYGVTLYVGRVFVMLWAGERILKAFRDSPSPAWAFAAGLFLYSLLSLAPLAGGLVTFVTVVIGLGAMMIAKKELVGTLQKQKVV